MRHVFHNEIVVKQPFNRASLDYVAQHTHSILFGDIAKRNIMTLSKAETHVTVHLISWQRTVVLSQEMTKEMLLSSRR